MTVLLLLVASFGMALFVIFFSAVLEAVVEYVFGIPSDYVPWLAKNKAWMIPLVAIALGVVGAFIFQIDLFYIYGQFIEGVMTEITGTSIAMNIYLTPFGIVLTGVWLARGSNFVHEFFKKHFNLETALKKWSVWGEPKPKG